MFSQLLRTHLPILIMVSILSVAFFKGFFPIDDTFKWGNWKTFNEGIMHENMWRVKGNHPKKVMLPILHPWAWRRRKRGQLPEDRKWTITVGKYHQTKSVYWVLLTHDPNREESRAVNTLSSLLDNLSSSAGASHPSNLVRSRGQESPLMQFIHANLLIEQPEKGTECICRDTQQLVTTEMRSIYLWRKLSEHGESHVPILPCYSHLLLREASWIYSLSPPLEFIFFLLLTSIWMRSQHSFERALSKVSTKVLLVTSSILSLYFIWPLFSIWS